MPFTINDPEVERLARELAAATGEPVPAAIAAALRERLARARTDGRASVGGRTQTLSRAGDGVPTFDSVEDIQRYVASLPVLDPRSPDEIVGYDAAGLPT